MITVVLARIPVGHPRLLVDNGWKAADVFKFSICFIVQNAALFATFSKIVVLRIDSCIRGYPVGQLKIIDVIIFNMEISISHKPRTANLQIFKIIIGDSDIR